MTPSASAFPRGHSYGGAVITVAGVEQNVVGLVYLAGYALEEGEILGELQGRFPDSPLASAPGRASCLAHLPAADNGVGFGSVDGIRS